MANIADVTIYDGAPSPVAHVMKAISVTRVGNKITAFWREQLPAVPVEAQVRFTTTLTELQSGVWQPEVIVEFPVMESISGQNSSGYTAAPKVAFIDKMKITMFAHRRSTVNSRRTTRQFGLNLLDNYQLSVAPTTTGFLPDLFDQLISAT